MNVSNAVACATITEGAGRLVVAMYGKTPLVILTATDGEGFCVALGPAASAETELTFPTVIQPNNLQRPFAELTGPFEVVAGPAHGMPVPADRGSRQPGLEVGAKGQAYLFIPGFRPIDAAMYISLADGKVVMDGERYASPKPPTARFHQWAIVRRNGDAVVDVVRFG